MTIDERDAHGIRSGLAGPLIVALGTVLLASMSSAQQAVATLLFLGILRIVHDYVIYPRLIGRDIHLHPWW